MRIFYASWSSPNPLIPSRGWRRNLHDSLRSMGHEVIDFDYDLDETARYLDPSDPAQAAFIAQNRPRLTTELLRQIEAVHASTPVRLFFSYFYDACVEPAALDRIRALGITTMNWYCNASYQMHLVREISPRYDACLVPERFRLGDYTKIGARPIYCQEAANPEVYHPRPVAEEFDVAFVGHCYGDRASIVLWLRSNGVDVRVWGPRWECHVRPRSRNPLKRWIRQREGLPAAVVGGVLPDSALSETYCRSKINLGFSTCGDTHRSDHRIVQIRLRDFEVPMSGGFYLVEHIEEFEEFFEIGREIETYRSREELLDKIRFYLANDTARRRIALAGRQRCLRDHTWQRRFEDVFHEIGLT